MIKQDVNLLWRILMKVASDDASSSIICVLDAIDECEKEVMELRCFYLCSCPNPQRTWLKFLFTNQPRNEVQDFQGFTYAFPCVRRHYENPLASAAGSGHESVVRMLLNWGAPVDDYGTDRGNPLHVACRAGHEQIVRILLEKGADVNALDQWGNSALQVALDSGYDNIVQMLRQNEADDRDLRDWTLV